jgi:hypothetical protein
MNAADRGEHPPPTAAAIAAPSAPLAVDSAMIDTFARTVMGRGAWRRPRRHGSCRLRNPKPGEESTLVGQGFFFRLPRAFSVLLLERRRS